MFERDRPRLRRIARRILGDWDQAEEAVQETWLKTDNIPSEGLRDASAWFTTIVTRVCLDRLRHRRRHTPRQVVELDDPANEHEVAGLIRDGNPEQAALAADSVGVALLIVLERLRPLERVAFVLHDVFDLPFAEIAPLIDRSPEAVRQLASRARRRMRGKPESDTGTISRHRELAEAFLKAARNDDVAALVKLLDPEVVLTADEQAARMGAGPSLSGADQVARFFAGRAAAAHVAIINGKIGIIVAANDRLVLAVLPQFEGGRVRQLHAIAAPGDLAQLDVRLLPASADQRPGPEDRCRHRKAPGLRGPVLEPDVLPAQLHLRPGRRP
jgi:RNA polymerase sigma-70 factor, ECF subfamily